MGYELGDQHGLDVPRRRFVQRGYIWMGYQLGDKHASDVPRRGLVQRGYIWMGHKLGDEHVYEHVCDVLRSDGVVGIIHRHTQPGIVI